MVVVVVMIVVVIMVVTGMIVVVAGQLLGSSLLGRGVQVLNLGLAEDAGGKGLVVGRHQSYNCSRYSGMCLHVAAGAGRAVDLGVVDDEQNLTCQRCALNRAFSLSLSPLCSPGKWHAASVDIRSWGGGGSHG